MSPDHIDYSHSDIWHRLDSLLTTVWQPRPTTACGRVQCEPSWRWNGRLKDCDLWYVVEGEGRIAIEENEYPISGGTLFFLRPGDQVRANHNPSNPLTVVFIHFNFVNLSTQEIARVDPALLPSRCIRFERSTEIELLMTRAVRAIKGIHPLAGAEAIFLLQQVLIEAYRQDALARGIQSVRPDPRILRVVEHVRKHPAKRIDLHQASTMAQLSPHYFSRRFKDEVGLSFRDFVIATRLARARVLLEETAMSVAEVAAALGYDDAFFFSRQFKNHFGISPKEARLG